MRPPEHLKAVASELSDLLFAKNGSQERMRELLQQLSYEAPNPQAPENAEKTPGVATDKVGIWRRQTVDGATWYERDRKMGGRWRLWADTERIYPKTGKRRVVLMGESVSRGYYYDPYFTVAMEMEKSLNNSDEGQETEVVDLGRTALSMDELRTLMEESTVLEPDAVVVFAGNNWLSALTAKLTREEQEKIFEWVSSDRVHAVIPFLEHKMSAIVRLLLAEIKKLFVDRGIPVVYMIPPVNLRDWKNISVEESPTWLHEDRARAWMAARDRAFSALSDGQADMLAEAAFTMTQLDPSHPLGYELLADLYRIQGRQEEELKYLQLVRSTSVFNRLGSSAPVCLPIIADTIRSYASDHGIRVVDLRAIFLEETGEIPGRNLFLDYCHLNLEGIRIAVRHTVRSLLEVLTRREWAEGDIKDSLLTPSRKVLAIAHLCAVTQYAHLGQTGGILDHHCQQALSLSDDMKRVMMQYVDFTSRKAPVSLIASLRSAFQTEEPLQYIRSASILHLRDSKMMDVELNDAIVRSLYAAGVDVRDEITSLRVEQHAVGPEKMSLLESYYSLTSFRMIEIGVKGCYSRTLEPVRSFYFVVDGSSEVFSFEMVYRTPGRQYEGKTLKISIDRPDNIVSECPMSRVFTKHTFDMPIPLKKGIHKLLITWPTTFEPFIPVTHGTYNRFLESMFKAQGDINELFVYTRPGIPEPLASRGAVMADPS